MFCVYFILHIYLYIVCIIMVLCIYICIECVSMVVSSACVSFRNNCQLLIDIARSLVRCRWFVHPQEKDICLMCYWFSKLALVKRGIMDSRR